MLTVSTQIAREDDLGMFSTMLRSVADIADEIRVYAMEREDKDFVNVAKKYKAQVIAVVTPKVVEVIRARQVQEAKGDWVLIMDYDEVITPALAKEIKSLTQTDHAVSVYRIKRKNYSLGYPVSHGGFGDDYVHRLFYKKNFVDWPTDIHSQPSVKGEEGTLHAYMEHHKDASLSQMIAKTNRYSDIEARQFLLGGLAPVTRVTLIRKPLMEFVRRYFGKYGFLDGRIGLIQAIYQGYSVFITYAKLFELQRKKKEK